MYEIFEVILSHDNTLHVILICCWYNPRPKNLIAGLILPLNCLFFSVYYLCLTQYYMCLM